MKIALAFLITLSASAQLVSARKGDVLVTMSGWNIPEYYSVYDADGNLRGEALKDTSGVDLRSLGLGSSYERVPLRSGEIVIGESYAVFPRLGKYDPVTGTLTPYALPYERGVVGVRNHDVFADQCTVAWTAVFSNDSNAPSDEARLHAIRMFDICRDRPLPDLLLEPMMNLSPQFVRQLPNGDILVVTHTQIGRYDAFGKRGVIIATNYVLGTIALTPDATALWGLLYPSRMVRINLVARDEPPLIVNFPTHYPNTRTIDVWPGDVDVAGEWRASLQPPPPLPKRRAVTH